MEVVKFVEGEREAPGFVAWREREEKEWGGSPSWITKASVLVKEPPLLFSSSLFSRSTAESERERFKQTKRQIEEYAKTLPGCCFPVSLALCLSQKQGQRFDARIFTSKFLGFPV